MADLLNVDWMLTLNHLLLMAIAYLLAFPIGFDREEQGPRIGLRTFPLVAVVSCGFMLVGRAVIDSPGEQGRVLQGIVTGIGFIGGGLWKFGSLITKKAPEIRGFFRLVGGDGVTLIKFLNN